MYTLTSPKTIIELPSKPYIDIIHENNRNRRDLSTVSTDQDIDFYINNFTNLDSFTVNRNPRLDKELTCKKYINDELDDITIVRFNQTLENYPEVSVGNDVYNLAKYDKIKIMDITEIKFPKICSNLLQKWDIKNMHKKSGWKSEVFPKATKISSSTSNQEQLLSLQSVIALCVKKLHQITMVKRKFLFRLNAVMLFKLVIELFFILDFQF